MGLGKVMTGVGKAVPQAVGQAAGRPAGEESTHHAPLETRLHELLDVIQLAEKLLQVSHLCVECWVKLYRFV